MGLTTYDVGLQGGPKKCTMTGRLKEERMKGWKELGGRREGKGVHVPRGPGR